MRKNRITLEDYMRYMDDGRSFLHPIKHGWRWEEGGLKYREAWRLEDLSKTAQDITEDILRASMQDIYSSLKFTTEVGEGTEGWLPTLDIMVRVESSNIISYRYYEKPTTTNTTVRMASAMSENSKLQCLSNDLVRRLLNTRVELPPRYREEVIERYGTKLLTSGYGEDQVKKILINGVRGYITKKKRRQAGGRRRIHNTSEESMGTRIRKKLLGKTAWYKPKIGRAKDEKPGFLGRAGSERRKKETPMKTRAVLFVEQTPRGELASRIREVIKRLEPTLGYSLKVAERTGRSIQSLFSQTNLWQGLHCGREKCITCSQGGDNLPACTRSSIVYENICVKCNPDKTEDGEPVVKEGSMTPSLYVGESSRTIQERGLEHWGAALRGDKKSHMAKHQAMEHAGEPPAFHMRVVSYHRTALNRQVKEAVRIRRRGGASSILNSRAEYNRCHIPRLVLEEEDEQTTKEREQLELLEMEQLIKELEQEDISWEERRKKAMEQVVKKRRRDGNSMEPGNKDGEEQMGRKKIKRLKFSPLGEDWGEQLLVGVEQTNLGNSMVGKCDRTLPTLPVPQGRRGVKRKVDLRPTKPTTITDYFGTQRRTMEDRMVTNPPMEEFQEVDEDYLEWTAGWVGLKTKEEFEELSKKRRKLLSVVVEEEEEPSIAPTAVENIATAPSVLGSKEPTTDGEEQEQLLVEVEEDETYQAPSVEGNIATAPSIKGSTQLVMLVEENDYQTHSAVGNIATAPSVKGSNKPEPDGWEGRSSDDEDFQDLTQQYLDRKTTFVEEDNTVESKDDLEDDLADSLVSEDSQEGMVSMLELLKSFREEEDGQTPPPTLTILTPTQGCVDEGHSPEGGSGISLADTQQGSGLFPHRGTTALCSGGVEYNDTRDGATFVEKMSMEDPDDPLCPSLSGNNGIVPMSSHNGGGGGTQHCGDHIPPISQDHCDVGSTPSMEQHRRVVTDKISPSFSINIPVLDDPTDGGGAVQAVNLTDEKKDDPPRDNKDGERKVVQMRVVSRAAGLRGQLLCVHDELGTCSIHGPGAREMFKGYWTMEKDEDGQPKKVRKKKTWFQCDVGVNGGNLRQPKLSFGVVKTTRRVGNRDNNRYLGTDDASVGQ